MKIVTAYSHPSLPGHRFSTVDASSRAVERTVGPAFLQVLSGSVTLTAPDHRIVATSGWVIGLDGSEVATRCVPSGDARVFCVSPYAAKSAGHASSDRYTLPLPLIHERGSEVATAVASLFKTYEGARGFGSEARLCSAVEQALSAQRSCMALVARCRGRTFNERLERFVRIARARALIVSDWRASCVGRAAPAARMSQAHFTREFHAVFGESPEQLRRRLCMEEAKQLLIRTAAPVHEIMAAVGYSRLSCFSRAFSTFFGASPIVVRKRARSNAVRAEQNGDVAMTLATTEILTCGPRRLEDIPPRAATG